MGLVRRQWSLTVALETPNYSYGTGEKVQQSGCPETELGCNCPSRENMFQYKPRSKGDHSKRTNLEKFKWF